MVKASLVFKDCGGKLAREKMEESPKDYYFSCPPLHGQQVEVDGRSFRVLYTTHKPSIDPDSAGIVVEVEPWREFGF